MTHAANATDAPKLRSAPAGRPEPQAARRAARWGRWGAMASLLVCLPLAAQEPVRDAGSEAGDAAAAEAETSSRRVDESEENFRQRMELREQRFRDRQPSNTTFSYSTSREGKLANLPPESQRHIREQLSDLVIESRLWEPGVDLSDYPYEPSEAAAGDALLAQQEREAWVEQLQKYQEAEQAAHAAEQAAARAREAGGGPAGEAAQGQSGAAPGGSPGRSDGARSEDSGDASAAERQASRAGAAQAADRESAESTEAAREPSGVTESALDYLRRQGLAQQPGGGEGDDPDGSSPTGNSGAPGETGEEAGDAAGESSQLAAAGESGAENADGDESTDAGEEESLAATDSPSEPESESAPAGTVAVSELAGLDGALSSDSSITRAADSPATDGLQISATDPQPAAGTLGIEDLRLIDPRLLRVLPEEPVALPDEQPEDLPGDGSPDGF
ncbi:hypothetical protein [Elongatibacter sediminis]|uniref:Uncharacterized protein n=1 Tax=Elongatibacter sediminis TaxID=3119006 RepID=A0AAW9R5Z5_9GAMM